MTSIPTVVVVDDAAEIRALVRTRLRLSGRLDVVGEGASGHDAIALVEQHRPALLLLDVSMPGMDGLEALPRVREGSPETRVVMYSGFSEVGLAERTIELGAAAFFEKSTSLDTLVDDLLAVLGEPARAPADPGESEPVLEEHLERFRELFEDAAIGMATLTLSGRIVRVNQSLATAVRPPGQGAGVGGVRRLRGGPRRADGPRARQGGPEVAGRLPDRARRRRARRTPGAGHPLARAGQRGPPALPLPPGAGHQRPAHRRGGAAAVGGAAAAARRRRPGLRDLHAGPGRPRSRAGTPARSDSRAGPPTRSSASTSARSTRPSSRQRRHPEHELEVALADGPLRGGRAPDPQGRLDVLGARDHHRRLRPRAAGTSGSPRSPATSPSGCCWSRSRPAPRRPWPRPTRASRRPTPSCSRSPRTSPTSSPWRRTSCARPSGC